MLYCMTTVIASKTNLCTAILSSAPPPCLTLCQNAGPPMIFNALYDQNKVSCLDLNLAHSCLVVGECPERVVDTFSGSPTYPESPKESLTLKYTLIQVQLLPGSRYVCRLSFPSTKNCDIMSCCRKWAINQHNLIFHHINTNLITDTRTIVLVGIPLATWISLALLSFQVHTINTCKKYLQGFEITKDNLV